MGGIFSHSSSGNNTDTPETLACISKCRNEAKSAKPAAVPGAPVAAEPAKPPAVGGRRRKIRKFKRRTQSKKRSQK